VPRVAFQEEGLSEQRQECRGLTWGIEVPSKGQRRRQGSVAWAPGDQLKS
jgi:hypothetical protein